MEKLLNFKVQALPIETYSGLFSLSNDALLDYNARRITVDTKPGYPCRVSLIDAELGESVIALSHTHHLVAGPYAASGPIFIRELATKVTFGLNEVPNLLKKRFLSIRAYCASGSMRDACSVNGDELLNEILNLFADNEISYLHLHNANTGCYLCNVQRN